MTNEDGVRYNLKLSDEDILMLAGSECEETLLEVEKARARIALQRSNVEPRISALVVAVVTEARKRLAVCYTGTQIRHCLTCNQNAGYALYKSGPKRGESNYSKPRYIAGVEFAKSVVRMRGHVSIGGCTACVEKAIPHIREALAGYKAELPPKLQSAGYPKWKRYDKRECEVCGWVGGENEMRMVPAIMGGRYPGGCPKCHAKNELFNAPIKVHTGYVLVEETERKD